MSATRSKRFPASDWSIACIQSSAVRTTTVMSIAARSSTSWYEAGRSTAFTDGRGRFASGSYDA